MNSSAGGSYLLSFYLFLKSLYPKTAGQPRHYFLKNKDKALHSACVLSLIIFVFYFSRWAAAV